MAYAGGRESINNKKTGKKLTTAPFRQNNDASVRRTGITTTVLNDILIVHFEIDIKDLFVAGKNYPWPRPEVCPCCGGQRLWGHGYTPRYFDGCPRLIWFKRYVCVDCHSVHTLRPKTHWRRFQATVATILKSLRIKIAENRWVDGLSRQRQQYWLRGFRTRLKVDNPSDGIITYKLLRNLLRENIIAATHSLKWFQMIIRGSFVYVPAV
jgi:hypothetical protein